MTKQPGRPPAPGAGADGEPLSLPEGIGRLEWELEKVRRQNPRIRALLGCARLLEQALESNYSILHCSPERLQTIWRKARKLSELLRSELGRALREPSTIPSLEATREATLRSLEMLDNQVLAELDRIPDPIPPAREMEARKQLCVSLGKIQAFLQDTLGEILAADPRSLHDADYFLSRRFPRDLEEAEWLHASVSEFVGFLGDLETVRSTSLREVVDLVRRDRVIPRGETWESLAIFLEALVHDLMPRLRHVLALPAIRFDELESLDAWAAEIPIKCRSVIELGAAGLEAVVSIGDAAGPSPPERAQNLRDLVHCHAAVGERMLGLLRDLDRILLDLGAFLPLWQRNIEKRRALMLRPLSPREAETAELFGSA